jgi:hypothetical protein
MEKALSIIFFIFFSIIIFLLPIAEGTHNNWCENADMARSGNVIARPGATILT